MSLTSLGLYKIIAKTKLFTFSCYIYTECFRISRSQRDVKGEREARLKQMEGLEELIRRVNEEISTAETEKYQFQAAQRRADELIQSHRYSTCTVSMSPMFYMISHRAKEGSMQSQVQTCETHVRRLQSSRSDTLAAFGEDMRTLVNELQRNKRQFRKLPKGPIGSMIQVKDHKWCTAVEQVFKHTLKAFVVDNIHDLITFKAIVKRVVRRGHIPEAITSRFQDTIYDVRRNVSLVSSIFCFMYLYFLHSMPSPRTPLYSTCWMCQTLM